MTIKFEVLFLFYIWPLSYGVMDFKFPRFFYCCVEIDYIAAMADVNVFHLLVLGLHCYMLVSYSEVHRVHLLTFASQFCS